MAEPAISYSDPAPPVRRGHNRTSDAKVAECRNLRIVERLSLPEICARAGISKGTIFPYLKDIPLTPSELRKRKAEAALTMVKKRPQKRVVVGEESKFFHIIKRQALSTDQKGAIAEAAVIFRLKVWGLVPHIPLCPGGKSDIAVLITASQKVVRIQVKCARTSKWGRPFVSLRSRDGGKFGVRYASGSFDFFVGYDMREDVCYVYSTDELAGRCSGKSMEVKDAECWGKLFTK